MARSFVVPTVDVGSVSHVLRGTSSIHHKAVIVPCRNIGQVVALLCCRLNTDDLNNNTWLILKICERLRD